MRSGLCARSERKSNSPLTSMTTRVTSLSDQLRTAVTWSNSAPRIGPGWPAASSARSGMSVRFMECSMRNIVDLAVRIRHFANRVVHHGRDVLGGQGAAYRRAWAGSARLRVPPQPLAHFGHVVLRLWKRRHTAVAGNGAFAGIVGRQCQGLVALVDPQEV